MILVFAWALSGPITAAILSIASAVVALYFALGTREPSFFLQIFITGGLFVTTMHYLYGVQRRLGDRQIANEKLSEEMNLVLESIEKADELKAALGKKIERLLDLQRFSEELKGIQDTREVARKIVRETHEAFGRAEECALYVVDEERQDLALIAASSQKDGVVKEKEGSLFDKWVMKRSQAVLIEDSRNDFRFPTDIKTAVELRSLVASPLVSEKKVLGVLRLSSGAVQAFNADDLRFLDIITSLGAVALRNMSLFEKMRELAIRDSLTGLYLNRYFKERLAEEVQRAAMNKAPFSILMIDIDFFKRYNDEFGHLAGDLVLKNFAATLLKCTEPGDLVARYGGEEFVVLLPNREHAEAVKCAETIRRCIEQNKVVLRRLEAKITASIGVSTYGRVAKTAEALLEAADKNLYRAKNAGRNRVFGGTEK